MRFFVDEMPKTQNDCMFAVKDKLPIMTTSGKFYTIPSGMCSDGERCDSTGAGCHRLTVLNKDMITNLSQF